MKNIALFGGTFDPIHNGHLKVAEVVLSTSNFDEFWFVPSAVPPHKDDNMFTFEERIQMIRLATDNNNRIQIWDRDFRKNSKSFTILLIQDLKLRFINYNFSFIIGADNVLKLKTWKAYKELIELVDFIVVNRKTIDVNLWSSLDYYSKLSFINMPEYDISSSELRDMIRLKKDLSSFIPKRVVEFINKKRRS
jgi:nicotinate-nucleotide adenylyltransferase